MPGRVQQEHRSESGTQQFYIPDLSLHRVLAAGRHRQDHLKDCCGR